MRGDARTSITETRARRRDASARAAAERRRPKAPYDDAGGVTGIAASVDAAVSLPPSEVPA
jgi:hypothetical protein